MSYRLIDNETNEDIIDKLGRIKDERDKYKKILDKIKEILEKGYKRKDGFLELNEWQTRDLNELLEEIE